MRLLLTTLLLLLSSVVWAQESGCNSSFKGGDRSDYDKGVEAYSNKRWQQCLTLMKKVSQHNRGAADPYFYMGVAAVKLGEKPATVRNYFNRLFKYCPDYPNALAHYYMAVVHYSYKHYDDATRELNAYFDMVNQNPSKEYDAVYEEASNYLYWSEFLSQAMQNQVPFYPTVVPGASTKADEYLPYLTCDGEELYFLRQVPARRAKSFYESQLDEKVLRLYCSVRKDTAYTYGEMLPSPFNEQGDEGGVTLTADNRTLYYSVLRHDGGYDNCDIYCCHRKNGIWQTLENVGRNINGERTWESQPSITPDGQYLYFASNRPGGQGGTDIWMCRRLPNGDWSRAENLGPAVNTPGNEKCPFIHADGKTLYFASNGWQGFGGYDMFFIDLTDTYLQRPTNMGLPVNSENDDICIGVTADGKRGYFANRPKADEDGNLPDLGAGVGGTDIYTFELYPAAQPEEMAIVKGKLRSSDGKPLKGQVSVLRQRADADIYIVDGDDGCFALALSAKDNNAVVVSVAGYMPRALYGNAAQLRRELSAADFVLMPATLWGRFPLSLPRNGKNVLPLGKSATVILDAYADYLIGNPRMHVRIEAPTMDEAKAIHDYLLSRQLRPERLEYKPNSALSAPQITITQL